MKADILTLKALFHRDVRYVIPTFQRPYVWTQELQWEPLWNDVRNTAEEYLENLASMGEGKEAAAEERTGVHFLGAVVLQPQATGAGELESRHVIDGQQRLTTLQLLLDAAQEVFEQDGSPKEEKQLRKLVLNDEDYVTLPEHRFKVSPTMIDKEAFISAMSNDLSVEGFEGSPIVQAHEFFKLQIRQWLAGGDAGAKSHGLATALMVLLQTVVIDLTTADDANIIFETLNARGTPLLASDLIKNSILHTASDAGLNGDALYARPVLAADGPVMVANRGGSGTDRASADRRLPQLLAHDAYCRGDQDERRVPSLSQVRWRSRLGHRGSRRYQAAWRNRIANSTV